MCGIAGYIIGANRSVPDTLLTSMAGAIFHRGPDEEGFYRHTTQNSQYLIALAHRRLSIIDLDSGQQPMSNSNGSIHIVFNGEIYNFQELRNELKLKGYVFNTSSDTEVIIHAYEEFGEKCVDKLRGMFAFAIWDSKNERMFIARDWFGKKPLYIYNSDNEFLFASEIKSLLEYDGIVAAVDHGAVSDYLLFRYVPAPASLFKDIFKLLPGSCAVWEKGKLKTWSYYTPPDCNQLIRPVEQSDAINTYMGKLDEAVRIRMVSDVPFGAFLSGGIDSSVIVGLMDKHSDFPIKTFSVGFKEAQYSELGYAKVIADHFKTDHTELTVSQDHIMELLPSLIRYRDAPVAEPSDIPIYMLAKEARKTVKMVLTGEGSDEILGGYPKHVYERYVKAYHLMPRIIRSRLVSPLVSQLPYRFRRAKTAIEAMNVNDWTVRMARWFGALNMNERDALLNNEREHSSKKANLAVMPENNNSSLRKILCFDQTVWLPDNLLERGDRMTMAASIEARMPFMDHELAAYASSLPDDFRVRGRTTKWILRKGAESLLPQVILERPKVGFRVPVNEWFKGPMKDYLYDNLTGNSSRTRNYYDADVLQRILSEHVHGKQNHEKLLWSLLSLELWHQEYNLIS